MRRRLVVAAAGGALLLVLWLASRSPAFVEYVYARVVGFQIARALSVTTGLVPASLAEFVIAGLVLFLLTAAGARVLRLLRRRLRLRDAVLAGLTSGAALAVVILSVFHLAWGVNYARAPLAERFGWPPIETPADDEERRRQTEEIAAIARGLIEATNVSYRAFAGTDDLGRPSVRPAGTPVLDDVLDDGFARVQARLGLEPAFAASRGPAKPLLASELMSHLGLGGFYFPWTGEANYNSRLPASTLPQAVAHEKAHQRGIAREDEAGFIGFLACVLSDDPYTRYSGYAYAERQLLGELARRDAPASRRLAALRVPGVTRDLEYVREFWRRYEGAAARMSVRVNNAYLRTQGERRGVAAYQASRSLIVLFARAHGGSAVAR